MTRHIDAKASEDKSMTDDEVLRVLHEVARDAAYEASVDPRACEHAEKVAQAHAAVAALQAERDADKAALEALRGQVAGLVAEVMALPDDPNPYTYRAARSALRKKAALLAMENSGEF